MPCNNTPLPEYEVIAAQASAAQLDTARGYLRACLEYFGHEEAASRLDALPDGEVVRRALQYWPEGWGHFCGHFASDIRAFEAEHSAGPGATSEPSTVV